MRNGSGSDPPDVSATPAPRNPAHTAGVLLITASSLDLITWTIESVWNLSATIPMVIETALQAALGVGLLRSSRRWELPALVFIAGAAVIPCIRTVLFTPAPPAIVAVITMISLSLGMGLLRVLPLVILLTGKVTRLRFVTAISVFVFQQLTVLASTGLRIYSQEWMSRR